jgi:GH24 family phage-related lysozyme (muramidase)
MKHTLNWKLQGLLGIVFILLSLLLLSASWKIVQRLHYTYKQQEQAHQIENQRQEVLEKSVTFLKTQEGFRATLYHCKAGVKTIGYGNTTIIKEPGVHQTLTEEQATYLLQKDINVLHRKLETYKVKLVGSTGQELQVSYKDVLNVYQQTALISFLYNLGERNFNQSQLKERIEEKVRVDFLHQKYNKKPLDDKQNKRLRKLNEQIKKEFLRWSNIKVEGQVLPLRGLLHRRTLEASLFLTVEL